MEMSIGHDELDAALQRCGATWDAAQTHGLLSGRLAIAGAGSGPDWLAQVLEGTDSNDALRSECAAMLGIVFESTLRQLAERQSGFEPLLPGDDDSTAVKAAALAHWTEGFLHGLVAAEHGDALKKRLAEEPLAEIIKDMLEITRATADSGGSAESDDEAYAELVEYVRVAAQLTYEELAEFRPPADDMPDSEHVPEVLH